ncbi:MAG: GNAT family N-acetyltransferase [Bacilli bacterium]|nr:GNAT family N-acetyltransferase [Bacilli bacterium]
MIRLANTEDISAIYELGTILHKNYKIVNNLEKMMKEPYFKIFVALYKKKIIGFLSITEFYETVDIIDLFVLKKYRRQHFGSLLINYMISNIGKEVSLITLEVNVNNKAAIALYEKFDFEVICKRIFYYGNEDAYLMGRRCIRE